jgi:hypothetical protein
VTYLENFVRLSDVVDVPTSTPALSGIGTSVISSGYTYNFWGDGQIDHQQSLNNGQTYYIMRTADYPELALYQGDSTIGTMWIETPVGDVYTLPVRFDETGIYFTPSNNFSKIPAGSTFKFTQALILQPQTTV